jgi:hypothetical protein
MPIEINAIGIPLEQVDYTFGKLRVVLRPSIWKDYWDWWIIFEERQTHPTFIGLYGPGEINEIIVRELVDHCLKNDHNGKAYKYWEGGKACR